MTKPTAQSIIKTTTLQGVNRHKQVRYLHLSILSEQGRYVIERRTSFSSDPTVREGKQGISRSRGKATLELAEQALSKESLHHVVNKGWWPTSPSGNVSSHAAQEPAVPSSPQERSNAPTNPRQVVLAHGQAITPVLF